MHFFFELHICHAKDEIFIYYFDNTSFAVQYCMAKAREMEKQTKLLKTRGSKKMLEFFIHASHPKNSSTTPAFLPHLIPPKKKIEAPKKMKKTCIPSQQKRCLPSFPIKKHTSLNTTKFIKF